MYSLSQFKLVLFVQSIIITLGVEWKKLYNFQGALFSFK